MVAKKDLAGLLKMTYDKERATVEVAWAQATEQRREAEDEVAASPASLFMVYVYSFPFLMA